MSETETRIFEPSGGIPNSRYPAVIYRDALPREARQGRAACALLVSNGWGGNWLYGVYPFWHFHTKGHEVLACTAGRARLGLGGEGGMEVEVRQGDVCVLPAGVGHRCLQASGDFQMAGGYPPGQEGDIVRPGEIAIDEARAKIAALPLPTTHPLSGKADGIVRLWQEAAG
jgi:uncharacterized protein YjlB